MISISHAPNTTKRQQRLALQALLPWNWRSWQQGPSVEQLELAVAAKHHARAAVAFSSGREALAAVLSACGIKAGDEVIIQAYTCIVVPNAVIANDAIPVYADIDETLNIDPASAERKITPKTKAIIVQHTFGVPADMTRLQELCQKHHLLLIEDCAHALGATYQGKLVGTFGDAAIFSFGRDKIISSVSGGMAITSNLAYATVLRSAQNQAPSRPAVWIWQNLNHPLIVPFCSRMMGRLKIGEILLRLAQILRLLNRVYTADEKASRKHKPAYYKMPNAMASLALQQWEERLDPFNEQRQKLARAYQVFCQQSDLRFQKSHTNSEPVYLRFTVFTDMAALIRAQMKRRGYVLGDWYREVIMPSPLSDETVRYKPGSCPKAEAAARMSLNLPTHHHVSLNGQRDLLQTLKRLL